MHRQFLIIQSYLLFTIPRFKQILFEISTNSSPLNHEVHYDPDADHTLQCDNCNNTNIENSLLIGFSYSFFARKIFFVFSINVSIQRLEIFIIIIWHTLLYVSLFTITPSRQDLQVLVAY